MGLSVSSPHGIGAARWKEIALAFELGGYVTVYEADAFLRLTRGDTKRAVLAGKLAARPQQRGTKVRYLVRASEAEAALGKPEIQAPQHELAR
jgi:hypothetical protein